ncbi:hypothetical protein RB653_005921 [Dictyostelium firmibasis]|uniref:NAC-A/B domain-containing protein n=1 Tax=Dictyostelium firmibasis TaxID=79012 RepID=A0AAN7ULV1_9MYCE
MADTNTDVKKVTKGEKKTREAMKKLGLSPVNDIFRVTIKQKEGVLVVVAEPEVYASPSGETYVVFGDHTFDDIASRLQRAAPKANVDDIVKAAMPAPTAVKETEESEEIVAQAVDNFDYQGVSPKDVEVVMKETKASREKVVETLKKNNNDLVSAVLDLTTN